MNDLNHLLTCLCLLCDRQTQTAELEREAGEYLSSLQAHNRIGAHSHEEIQVVSFTEACDRGQTIAATAAAAAAVDIEISGISTVADDLGLFLQQEFSASSSSGGREPQNGDQILSETSLDHILDPLSLASLFEEEEEETPEGAGAADIRREGGGSLNEQVIL
jgi:hypothetical protein